MMYDQRFAQTFAREGVSPEYLFLNLKGGASERVKPAFAYGQHPRVGCRGLCKLRQPVAVGAYGLPRVQPRAEVSRTVGQRLARRYIEYGGVGTGGVVGVYVGDLWRKRIHGTGS